MTTRKTISIRDDQEEWIQENHLSLSSFVQEKLDELIEMPWIQRAIDLEEFPSPSTLCKAFNQLDMAVWRVLLNLSVILLPTNGIDASGFDHSHASKHYTKRQS